MVLFDRRVINLFTVRLCTICSTISVEGGGYKVLCWSSTSDFTNAELLSNRLKIEMGSESFYALKIGFSITALRSV